MDNKGPDEGRSKNGKQVSINSPFPVTLTVIRYDLYSDTRHIIIFVVFNPH